MLKGSFFLILRLDILTIVKLQEDADKEYLSGYGKKSLNIYLDDFLLEKAKELCYIKYTKGTTAHKGLTSLNE